MSDLRLAGRIRIREMMTSETITRNSEEHRALESDTRLSQVSVWRERVVQWYYNIVDHLDVSREVVYIAMNILDRVLAVEDVTTISKEEYELTSTTALFLAIRVFGSKDLKISELLQLCRSRFQTKDIQQRGSRILEKVALKKGILTSTAFAKSFLELLQPVVSSTTMMSLFEAVTYLLEISVFDDYFRALPPSMVAFAAVSLCVSSDRFGITLDTQSKNAFLSALSRECDLSLHSSKIEATTTRLQSIYGESQDSSVQQAPNIILDEDDVSPELSSQSSLESLVPISPLSFSISHELSHEPRKRARLS